MPRDEHSQRAFFAYSTGIELRYDVLPEWYKNEASRRQAFESQYESDIPVDIKRIKQQYDNAYKRKRRRLPNDTMSYQRPQSDIDPQKPTKPRKCMACRCEFQPVSNTNFRCKDCLRLHNNNPPAFTGIIF